VGLSASRLHRRLRIHFLHVNTEDAGGSRLAGPELRRFEIWGERGPVVLGPHASHAWRSDPRRFPIVLARYKVVAKLLAGKQSALEVGCGDGFNARIVLQAVPRVHGIDADPFSIDWAAKNAESEGLAATFSVADASAGPIPGSYDAVYSLDVIEHVPNADEARFIENIVAPLDADGVCIIGTPNITAHQYASPLSREGHINLKSAETLRASLAVHFANVFVFSMNDEVLHLGYAPMAHYLLALATGIKR
jgi:2-polyprenyl-3-methyl-5-hydroxy-6-metoxy-1,4-benzoquinol methylase